MSHLLRRHFFVLEIQTVIVFMPLFFMFLRSFFLHILRNRETKGNSKIEKKRALSFSPLPLFVSLYPFVNVYISFHIWQNYALMIPSLCLKD